MTDIEIARKTKLYDIKKIAKNLGINNEYLETYGKYKAKIDNSIFNSDINKNGKLILVTAINPTPLGEGKTTMSIAIADGLRRIGKNSILALREPSLGPVFGIKGGATGGGKVQIAPMEDINLHFTGDIHALTSANNLLSALIDNHIYFGNELGFDKVVWKRCLDLNDRQLRSVETGLSKEKNIVPRLDHFDITVASEMMAILCLSKDINDLKRRISNIIVGYTKDDKPIYCKDLKAEGSLTVLLKDAIKPNLVQTLEHTPAIVHGGPFANIAHGCNSVIATNLAMRLSDYVVTEAGFGADLGAEKFLDIKCRSVKHPDAVVLVATLKALKYHGGAKIEDCKSEDIASLDKGIDNLYKHVDNLRNKFGLNVIVAINKYNEDTKIEINYLRNKLEEQGIELSLVEGYKKGGKGAIDIANKLVDIVENRCKFKFVYDLDDSIYNKVNKVCKEIYGASNVIFSDSAKESIKRIEKLKLEKVPVCSAKTQYSLSDNPKNLLCDRSYDITIRDVELKNGAGFVVCKAGTIMTMPGLPKVPAANSIDIDENNNIVGIF